MKKRNKIYRKLLNWFKSNDWYMGRSVYIKLSGDELSDTFKATLPELAMFDCGVSYDIKELRELQIISLLFCIEMTN